MKRLTKIELWTDIGIIASFITLAGMAMYGISYYGLYRFDGVWEKYVSPVPSVMVKGLSAILSINKFGGDPSFTPEFVSEQYIPILIAVAISMIFTFLIVPFVFIRALEALRSGKRNLIYYFGITVMVWVLGWNVIGLSTALTVTFNTSDSAAQSRELDRAREYLAYAAYLAAEELVMNYDIGSDKKLNDLGNNLTAHLRDLENMDTERFDMVVNKELSDSTLVLHLVMVQDSDNAEVKNINGDTGKKELVVEVNPENDRIFKFIKSNPK